MHACASPRFRRTGLEVSAIVRTGISNTPRPSRQPAHRGAAAIAAAAWCALFGAVHVYWALGGAVGLPTDLRLIDHPKLFIADLVAIPLCFTFAYVCIALRRDRTRVSLLIGAGLICLVHSVPTLIEYGWRLISGAGLQGLSERESLAVFVYEPFWFLGGVLLLLARRTPKSRRPVCAT